MQIVQDISCCMEQRKVQWMIADFLCNHYLEKNYIKVSDKMEDGQSCISLSLTFFGVMNFLKAFSSSKRWE